MKVSKLVSFLNSKYPFKISSREPFKVLISTILSQRTRDENTEIASSNLFSKYTTPQAIADARLEDIESPIKPAGFYRVKARRIRKISRIILRKFNGRVPSSFEELLTLPEVGRKTANCVLVFAYGKDALPVDTHVHRISNRLGLVSSRTPHQTEAKLKSVIPKRHWKPINAQLVQFGREICRPINPQCSICGLNALCQFRKKRLQIKQK